MVLATSKLLEPLFFGKAKLRNRILYAPLAGCSDYPFRQMANRYNPGIVYCEMVKMDALIRNDPHTYRLLDYEPGMHPIGAQLCGSKLKMAATCARIVEDLGFDVLDFNCGCPVDKVAKDGSGSAMLKTPELIGEIIHEMIQAVSIPVTVKIRAGWDSDTINAPYVTQIAEQAGAKAITVHGRTRAQAYKGPANWDYIKECKKAANEILVIGNGDIFDADAALKIVQHTDCDAILVSRGTMGQPWIVEDIQRAFQGLPKIQRTPLHFKKALLEHFHLVLKYRSEKQALLDFRRVGHWYLKHVEGTKALRMSLNKIASTQDALSFVEQFPWEEL